MPADVQIADDIVRVTRWTLAVGEQTGVHRHTVAYVVVPLTDGLMLIHHSGGGETRSTVVGGVAYRRDAGAEHTVENAGDSVLEFVEVEITCGS